MAGKLSGEGCGRHGCVQGDWASIATHLAAEGARVVVNYSTSKEGADRVVAEIVKKGGKAVAVQANVSKEADIIRLFAETKKAFERVDILVNNAGVYDFAPLENVTAEQFHRMFDLNVLGLILASKEAVKLFGPNGGSIINIGSVAGTSAPATTTVYSATKGAVDTVTKALAKELGPAQDPRQFDQSGNGGNRKRGACRWNRRGRLAQADGVHMLLGRIGQPADIAWWLCSWRRMTRRGSPVSCSISRGGLAKSSMLPHADNLADHFAGDVGQAEPPAVVFISESFMVEARASGGSLRGGR